MYNLERFKQAQESEWGGVGTVVSPNDIFSTVLTTFYDGKRDYRTLSKL